MSAADERALRLDTLGESNMAEAARMQIDALITDILPLGITITPTILRNMMLSAFYDGCNYGMRRVAVAMRKGIKVPS